MRAIPGNALTDAEQQQDIGGIEIAPGIAGNHEVGAAQAEGAQQRPEPAVVKGGRKVARALVGPQPGLGKKGRRPADIDCHTDQEGQRPDEGLDALQSGGAARLDRPRLA